MIQILPYQEKFDTDLRALCRIPVSGHISLALEREPCYIIGSKVQCEREEVYVAYDDKAEKVWAVFNIGWRRLWYQQKVEKVRYLCDLRIHPNKQNSSLLFSIIKKLKEQTQDDLLPAQTVVFADNHKMNSAIKRIKLKKGSGAIPYYHHIGSLHTYLIPLKSNKKTLWNCHIRGATKEDIQNMQALMDKEGQKNNYFPYYDFSLMDQSYYYGLNLSDYFLLYENNQLVGMAAIWDQSAFKQTRISAYSSLYQIIRPVYNLFSGLLSYAKLPVSGNVLHYCYLHSLLIEDRKPECFEKLLRHIQSKITGQGYDYLLCSLDPKDPLSSVPEKVGYARKVKGNYFLINQGQGIPIALKQKYFYLEGARI